MISCNSNKKNEIIANEVIEIDHIKFKQNPAENYFFTRKYKLTKKDSLVKMENKNYLLAKKLIDSLPLKIINDKKNIGHSTIPIDSPDWQIEIFLTSSDTITVFSGGLPAYMKNYEKLGWEILPNLDRQ